MSIRSLPTRPVNVAGHSYVSDEGDVVSVDPSTSTRHVRPTLSKKELRKSYILTKFPDKQPPVEGQTERNNFLRDYANIMLYHGANMYEARTEDLRSIQIQHIESRRKSIELSASRRPAPTVEQDATNPQKVYKKRFSDELGTVTSDGINPEFKGYSNRLGLLDPHERAQVLAISGRRLLRSSPDIRGKDKQVMTAFVETFEAMRHELESHPKGKPLSEISSAGLELIDHYSKMNFDTWLDKSYPVVDILGGAHPEYDEDDSRPDRHLSYNMEEHSRTREEMRLWSNISLPMRELMISRRLRTGIKSYVADDCMKGILDANPGLVSASEKSKFLHANQGYVGPHLGINRNGYSEIDSHVQEVKDWKRWNYIQQFDRTHRNPLIRARNARTPEPDTSDRAKAVINKSEKAYAFRKNIVPR
jgi:hypothetical protein